MAKSNKISYRDALAEIEAIIDKIENDELDIDDLSEKVSRVSFLIKICKEKLYNTEKEIEKILKEVNHE
jgi:exodeoxyribonuclease VII small subunit